MGIHLQLPPSVASCLTIAFIVFLFRRDIRERPNVTGALWLPLIWLVIGCSRGLSLWLNIFGIQVSGAASVEEGSPRDARFFLISIAVGLYILSNRGVRLAEIVGNNQWLTIFLLYCLVSIFFYDSASPEIYTLSLHVALPIMALIVLTEPDP